VVTEGIIENNYKEWPSLMSSEYHEPSKEMDLVCCFSLHIIPHMLFMSLLGPSWDASGVPYYYGLCMEKYIIPLSSMKPVTAYHLSQTYDCLDMNPKSPTSRL
jgi:hypothetical protein